MENNYFLFYFFFLTGSTLTSFLFFDRGEVEVEEAALNTEAGLFRLAARPARPIGLLTVGLDVAGLLSDADLLNGDGDSGTSFRSVIFIFSLTRRRADSFPILIAFSNAEDAVVDALFENVDDFDFPAVFFIDFVHFEQYQIERGSEISSFVAGGL